MSTYVEPEDYYKLMQTDSKVYTLEKYEPLIADKERVREVEELKNYEIKLKRYEMEDDYEFDIVEDSTRRKELLEDNIDKTLDIMEKLGMVEILNDIEMIKGRYVDNDIQLRIKILRNPPGIDFLKFHHKYPIGVLFLRLPISEYDKIKPELKFKIFRDKSAGGREHTNSFIPIII
jgi:hypothetical protein